MSITTHRARVAALTRSRPDDDPDLVEARRQLTEENLAGAIKRAVDADPRLTAAQRDRLALLLRGGDAA